MSYGFRNTIILFAVLIILFGSGLGYIHFTIDKDIEKQEVILADKQEELRELEQTISQFDEVQNALQAAVSRLENYPKGLFPNKRHSIIYGFLNRINQGNAHIESNIAVRQTRRRDSYGVLTSEFEGVGYFSHLYRFIAAIEKSKPINRLMNLELRGINLLDDLGKVNLKMTLDSYYELDESSVGRTKVLQINVEKLNMRSKPSTQSEVLNQLERGQNVEIISEDPNWVRVAIGNSIGWISNMYVKPVEYAPLLEINRSQAPIYSALFYPIIHDIPPNDEGLLNIEQSKLIGVSGEKAFILDNNQSLHELTIGDEVYLGTLRHISLQDETATFILNKGGIVEKITLKVGEAPDEKE